MESAAAVSAAPFAGNIGSQTIEVDAQPGQSLGARRCVAGEGYFRTMRMPILRGRDFSAADAGSEPVVVVSQELERRYFAGDALERRVRINRVWMTVIGIVPDTKLRALLEDAGPAFYFSFEQMPGFGTGEIVVRTPGAAAAIVPALRQAALGSNAGAVIASIDTVGVRPAAAIRAARSSLPGGPHRAAGAIIAPALELWSQRAARTAGVGCRCVRRSTPRVVGPTKAQIGAEG